MSINNVVLVGRLTKDVELKYTASGLAVGTFTLAVNRTFGDKETDFINCVVWKKQAENAANFLSKGSQAGITGRIQVRNYENNEGKRVYVTEVIAENVQFLDSKKDSGQQNGGRSKPANTNSFEGQGKPVDVDMDSLPF